jgi:uncharacterized lipoprotein YddW (UPF0748 family)
MSRFGPPLRGLAAFSVLIVLAFSSPRPVRATEPAPDEIRAMWVLRTSLTSPARIDALVRAAREHGFNTLLVQVRGRGDAYFAGGIEPRASDLHRQPATFDPLQTVLDAAQAAGLRVHAWVNVNLVSSAAELPTARGHVVYRHPEWLMVPREIAQDVAKVPTDSPAYVGKLARWTRTQAAEVEGLYSSPIVPAAARYTESVVRDLAARYAIDGVHFDYARYPNDTFDYSRAAIGEFRSHMRARIAPALTRELDSREMVDLFAYPDALPEAWRAFRVERMTMLMDRLGKAVKDARPGALVTVATKPDVRDALDRRLQDWGSWLDRGLVDAICPMAYTQEPERFAEQIAAVREAAGTRGLWAGIGAYRLTAKETIENIQTARRLGANGVVLFSYDSLIDPRQSSPDYLETVSRAAFAAARAGSAGSK